MGWKVSVLCGGGVVMGVGGGGLVDGGISCQEEVMRSMKSCVGLQTERKAWLVVAHW